MTDMKCVMHQVHGSSLSPHSSFQQNKHHVAPTTSFKRTTRWHVPTSWKAFLTAAINWSASCWNDPGGQQSVKHSVTLKSKASELNYWMLEDPTWRIRNPHLVAPSASSSPRAPSVLEVPAGVATTAPAVAHHRRDLLQSFKMHFELGLLGKVLSNCGIDLSLEHNYIIKPSSPVS